MILESYISSARVVPIGDVKFVLTAIRPAVGECESGEVNMVDVCPVQYDGELRVARGDLDLIPFTDGAHGVSCRLGKIIKSAGIVKPGIERIVDGDFQSIEANVFSGARCQRRSPDEYPAVAVRRDFEVKPEDKVRPFLLVNQHIVARTMWIQGSVVHGGARGRSIAVFPACVGVSVEQELPTLALFGVG